MKIRFKKYLRFWIWVDLIGLVLSIFLIITYLICGHYFSEHIQNLWSNLSIEILGVWLSVRVIDFLIQRHRSFKETRFHQLRNLKFFADTATHAISYYITESNIEILEQEIHYFDTRWPKRKRHFYKDEQAEILALKGSMPAIIQTSKDLYHYGEIEHSQVDFDSKKSELKQLLSQYRIDLERLRENIWQESHPDD